MSVQPLKRGTQLYNSFGYIYYFILRNFHFLKLSNEKLQINQTMYQQARCCHTTYAFYCGTQNGNFTAACFASAKRQKFLSLVREKRMEIIKSFHCFLNNCVTFKHSYCVYQNPSVIVCSSKKVCVYRSCMFRERRDLVSPVLRLFWKGNKTKCITITNNTA